MAHTPGPWTRIELSRGTDPAVARVVEQLVSGGRAAMQIEYRASSEGEANARLIALAPKMLDALTEASTILSDHHARMVAHLIDRQHCAPCAGGCPETELIARIEQIRRRARGEETC